MDYKEFSKTLKEKYPQYKDIDDKTLAEKTIEKYPTYKSQVTFDAPNNLLTKVNSEIKDVVDTGSANLFSGVTGAANATFQTGSKIAGYIGRGLGEVTSSILKGAGNVSGLLSKDLESSFDFVARSFKKAGIETQRRTTDIGFGVTSFLGAGAEQTKELILSGNEGYQEKKEKEDKIAQDEFVKAKGEGLSDEEARTRAQKKTQEFKYSDLTSKDFLVYDLFGSLVENAPTMALTIWTGGKIGGITKSFGPVARFLSEVSGTTVFSTGINAMREAESAYAQALQEGLSKEEATVRGERVMSRNFTGNIGLEGIQMLLLFAPQLRSASPFLNAFSQASKIAGAGAVEALQERGEDTIQAQAGNEKFDFFDALDQIKSPTLTKTDIISFVMGAAFEGVGNAFLDESQVKKAVEEQSSLVLQNLDSNATETGDAAVERLKEEIEKNPQAVEKAVEKAQQEIKGASTNIRELSEAEQARANAEVEIQSGKNPKAVALELSQKIGVDAATALVESIVSKQADVVSETNIPSTGETSQTQEPKALAQATEKLNSLLQKTPIEIQDEFEKSLNNQKEKIETLTKKVDELKTAIENAPDRSTQKVNLKKQLTAAKEGLKTNEAQFQKQLQQQAVDLRGTLSTYLSNEIKRGAIQGLSDKQIDQVIDGVIHQATTPEAVRTNFATSLESIVKNQIARVQRTAEPVVEKTQKEKVKEVLEKKSAASIKEIAKETKILEPNIRRILGIGAKNGEFERIANGVYRLTIGDQEVAVIIPGDAVETLPELAKNNFKADMIFLDIPYDTPAVKGGNRGVKYNLLSVEQFSKVLDNVKTILRDEDTPVIHMYSQAKSGLTAMEKYNNLFVEKGFSPIGRGEYTKLQKDGLTRVRNMRGNIIEPEGILVFNQSGNLNKNIENLNFTLVRPRGYQTEKPAEMLRAMIEMTTKEGDVVLDPFAGSGATGAEAVRAKRRAVLIEKNEKVAKEVTKPRVEAAVKEMQAAKKEKIQNLEKQLNEEYAKNENSKEILAFIATQMDASVAGQRIGLPDGETLAIKSSFPKWVPDSLRSSKLFNKVYAGLEIGRIVYPEANRSRQRALYQAIFDELDAQLDMDTKAIRNGIIDLYEETQDNNQEEAPAVDTSSAQRREEAQQGEQKIASKEFEPASPDDISQEVAERAFLNTSFDPEKRGETARKDYAYNVNNLYAELLPLAKSDAQKDILNVQIERFKNSYRDAFLAYLNSHARVISSMITGSGNFPVARNKKRFAASDNKVDAMMQLTEKARASIIRKLNAQKREDAGITKNTGTGKEDIGIFTGGKVIKNLDIDRIQILFDEKPGKEMISDLKNSAWRWSPREGAWQRKNTLNAIKSAHNILKFEYTTKIDEKMVPEYDFSDLKFKKKQIEENLTTRIIEHLGDRETVSMQFIYDLTNMPDVKQVERDIVRRILKDFNGADTKDTLTIDVKEFTDRVKTELLPLTTSISEGTFDGGGRYEYVNLSDELRGPIASYEERIYQSPIKTSAGEVHFRGDNIDNYFAHTRIEDLPVGETKIMGKDIGGLPIYDLADQSDGSGGTRRIIELQSDLFQRGRLENENFALFEDIVRNTTSQEKVMLTKKAQTAKDLRDFYSDIPTETFNKIRKGVSDFDLFNFIKGGFRGAGDDLAKLQPYRNIWWERIVREEIKFAAEENKAKLQFPVGETAMNIEGLGNKNIWMKAVEYDEGKSFETGKDLLPRDLEIGSIITREDASDLLSDDLWIITNVLEDGKFKAVPKNRLEKVIEDAGIAADSIEPSDWVSYAEQHSKKDLENLLETFDISGKIDTSNPIYKFYEKDIGKYLKNKYNAQRITDAQGVEWWEISIDPEQVIAPVFAFKKEGESATVIKEATNYLSDLKNRLKLDFDVVFVDTILAGKEQNVFDKKLFENVEAHGVTGDNTIALARDMAKGTAQHETVHLTLANIEKISAFKKEGLTRKNILTAKATQMGVEFTEKTASRIEEQLAVDFEKYVEKNTGQSGIINKFFGILKKMIVRFARAIAGTNGDIVKNYYDTLFEGKSIDTEMTYLQNKGLLASFSEDGTLRTTQIDIILRNRVKPMDEARALAIAERLEAAKTSSERLDVLNELSDAEIQAVAISEAGGRIWKAMEGEFAGVLDRALGVESDNFRFKLKDQPDKHLQKIEREYNNVQENVEKLTENTEVWKESLTKKIQEKEGLAESIANTPEDVKLVSRFIRKTPPKGEITERGIEAAKNAGFKDLNEAQKEVYDYLKQKTELVETRNLLRDIRRKIASTKKETIENRRALRDIERRLKLRKEFLERKEFYTQRGVQRGKKQQMRDIYKRGRLLRNIQDTIGLSDEKARQLIGGLGRQRIYTMTEKQFDDFAIEFINRGRDIVNTLDARDSVRAFIQEQQFQKEDNLRRALGLPKIGKMTQQQAENFQEILSQYEAGDIFLTQRQIETIHRTQWGDVKTERELHKKIFETTGISRTDLQNVEIDRTFQKYKNWLTLSRSNPLFAWLVDRRFKAMLQSSQEFISFEEELNPIVNAARKSRNKNLKEKISQVVAPTDEIVFGYIESENKENYAKEREMTKEELIMAHFLIGRLFEPAREYLTSEYGMKDRDNYITHLRRGVAETFIDSIKQGASIKSGVIAAAREIFASQREETAMFKILGGKTNEILAFEKWFKFAMPRTGELVPTKNVAKASLTYARAYFNKKQIDALVPEAMALAKIQENIKGYTPKGLPVDPTVQEFIKQFINDAKGRKIDFVTTQGDVLDNALKLGVAWTAFKYLGFRPLLGLVNFIGEFVANIRATTTVEKWNGLKRTLELKKSYKINEEYKYFTGRSPLAELFDPEHGIGGRIKDAAMTLFSMASFFNSRFYLRAKMTEAEWRSELISDSRMVEITKEMSKWRKTEFYVSSLAGHTAVGSAFSQFATWAIPIVTTTGSDIHEILKKIQKDGAKRAFTSEEAKSLGKTVAVMGVLWFIALGIKGLDDDDDQDERDIYFYITREMNTLLGAFQTVWQLEGRVPLLRDIFNLQKMIVQIFTQEKYKQDGVGYGIGDYKAIVTGKNLVTPSFVKDVKNRILGEQEKENTKMRLIDDAVKNGSIDDAEASKIAEFINPDGWNNVEGSRDADAQAEYQKTKIGEIKALFYLRKNHAENNAANILLDSKNNKEKIEKMVEYAKEFGVEKMWSEVKELYADKNLCSNTKKKTGCFVSGALYKDIMKAKNKLQ